MKKVLAKESLIKVNFVIPAIGDYFPNSEEINVTMFPTCPLSTPNSNNSKAQFKVILHEAIFNSRRIVNVSSR
jgi:hypothetical protein